MKLPNIRINKRIYVWSESVSCKRISNLNYKVTDMLNTLKMHPFVDPNIHNNLSTKLFPNKCMGMLSGSTGRVNGKTHLSFTILFLSSFLPRQVDGSD